MDALRAGLSVEEFWSLTPRETWMTLEARAWRMEHESERTGELIRLAQKMLGWLAWHVAALQRSKRLPALQRLIGGGQTKEMTPDEAAVRKAEFEELRKAAGKRADGYVRGKGRTSTSGEEGKGIGD
jgi:hypothetical protein